VAVLLKLQRARHEDALALLGYAHPWIVLQAITEIHQGLSRGALISQRCSRIEVKAGANQPKHRDRLPWCIA